MTRIVNQSSDGPSFAVYKGMQIIRHPSDASIEAYSWFRLKGTDMERLEEHLKVCDACRAKVTAEDWNRELYMAGLTEQTPESGAFRTPVGQPGRSRMAAVGDGSLRHGATPRVFHFRTHLPLYSLEAAAGKFGERQTDVEPDGWVAVTPGPVRLTRDMFVTHVKGDSMEPVIPDGSLCAFRSDVSEPYNGKIVLMEDYSEPGGNRYAIKRYLASGKADPNKKGDAAWLHERITLESINPDYAPMEIASAQKVNVIGEFVFNIPPRIRKAGVGVVA